MSTQIATDTARSDEIDLVDLIKTLWDKKWWIVLSTFVCTSLAGVYAFTAKERWTSKAEIMAPHVADLGNYFTIRKEYARIFDKEFTAKDLSDDLHKKFERLAYSLDEREKFLENSEWYKTRSQDLDAARKRKLLNELARENINVIKPDPKKEPDAIGRRFTFSAEKPELAQKTLKEFVEFIDQAAFKLDYDEFLIYANEKLNDLKFEIEQIKQNLNIQKNIQLANLNKALITAEKAEIKEYSKLFDNNSSKSVVQNVMISEKKTPLSDSNFSDAMGDSTYLFMLGEKYLKAQIDVEREENNIYPPRYYQIEKELKSLELIIEKAKTAKSTAFAYVSSPDYPIVKDKPKRVVILLIGGVLGLLFSCFMFIILFLMKNSRRV